MQHSRARGRLLLTVLAALGLLAASGCGDSAEPTGSAVTWTGARALTATEDTPSGVATDGTRVLFTTGRNQAGENAIREVAVEGETSSRILATTPGGLIPNGRIAIDGDVVYVAAGTGIVRMPIGGGDATAVVEGRPNSIDSVVVAGDDLWWTTWEYNGPQHVELARMPKAGGPVEVVAVNVAGALGRPYPDGDAALVASPIGVLRLRAGSPPEVVVDAKAAGGPVAQLAIDDQRLYIVVAGRDRLLAVPRAGGAPVVLADDVSTVGDIAVVGDQVVFFHQGSLGPKGRDSLLAVPAAGGLVRTIATGAHADGDLAVVGADRVVFSADWQVWVASVGG